MFSTCNKYDSYALQMIPSEMVEQIMAWVKYIPFFVLLKRRISLYFNNICSRRGRVDPTNNAGGGITIPNELQMYLNRIRGMFMANMEWGEDISYMKAAFLTLPFSQQYISFSNSKTFDPNTSPTTTNAAISLYLISLPIEHLLSAIGMTILRRYNITVSHHDVTVFNDCIAVKPVKTEKSKLFFLICVGSMTIIMIAMAEL